MTYTLTSEYFKININFFLNIRRSPHIFKTEITRLYTKAPSLDIDSKTFGEGMCCIHLWLSNTYLITFYLVKSYCIKRYQIYTVKPLTISADITEIFLFFCAEIIRGRTLLESVHCLRYWIIFLHFFEIFSAY